jgi:hypothetical protein
MNTQKERKYFHAEHEKDEMESDVQYKLHTNRNKKWRYVLVNVKNEKEMEVQR